MPQANGTQRGADCRAVESREGLKLSLSVVSKREVCKGWRIALKGKSTYVAGIKGVQGAMLLPLLISHVIPR